MFPVSTSEKSRHVMHFGHKYNYKHNSTSEKADDFTDVIEELETYMHDLHSDIPSERFVQCIINRYLPGQGISGHIDNTNYCLFNVWRIPL